MISVGLIGFTFFNFVVSGRYAYVYIYIYIYIYIYCIYVYRDIYICFNTVSIEKLTKYNSFAEKLDFETHSSVWSLPSGIQSTGPDPAVCTPFLPEVHALSIHACKQVYMHACILAQFKSRLVPNLFTVSRRSPNIWKMFLACLNIYEYIFCN